MDMSTYGKIQPHKIFVRHIPHQTTADELKQFFMMCGNVTFLSLVPLDKERIKEPNSYLCGFVKFETQESADQAVSQLNGKVFINKNGVAGAITVVYALDKEPRPTLNTKPLGSQKVFHENINELWQRYKENEEKLKKIYYDPAVEQELNDLELKVNQLQTKKEELESKFQSATEENEILKLKLKLVELDVQQMKLKGENI